MDASPSLHSLLPDLQPGGGPGLPDAEYRVRRALHRPAVLQQVREALAPVRPGARTRIIRDPLRQRAFKPVTAYQ